MRGANAARRRKRRTSEGDEGRMDGNDDCPRKDCGIVQSTFGVLLGYYLFSVSFFFFSGSVLLRRAEDIFCI
jgi:hypothetical protein